MERGVFPRPEIEERLRRFVLVRLLVDSKKPEDRSKEWNLLLHQEFRTGALPLYAVFTADRKVLGSTAFAGGSADAFAKILGPWLDGILARAGK